ncbi:MAG: hypothetical protein EOP11_15335 [Proteobacteria bacterium]|nr:MAG: hypothetical protein EOP11_15335 [Pseudomonadota bacterium]
MFYGLSLGLLLAATSVAGLSFHYNDAGGFGFYRPEGWAARDEGRSTRLTGPATDSAQTEIFAASDWISSAQDLPALRGYVKYLAKGAPVGEKWVGELRGYSFTDARQVSHWFILREKKNVLILEYRLAGSEAQREEALAILSSFQIRTGGISYP